LGGEEDESASDDSLAPELLHSALRLDDDIDVEESDEESQHIIRKSEEKEIKGEHVKIHALTRIGWSFFGV
jgi:hypothetical protein